MGDAFVACNGCSRHVKSGDASCPFCGATRDPVTAVVCGEDAHARGLSAQRATFAVALAAAAGLSLGACYGGPPHPRPYDPPPTTSGTATSTADAGGATGAR